MSSERPLPPASQAVKEARLQRAVLYIVRDEFVTTSPADLAQAPPFAVELDGALTPAAESTVRRYLSDAREVVKAQGQKLLRRHFRRLGMKVLAGQGMALEAGDLAEYRQWVRLELELFRGLLPDDAVQQADYRPDPVGWAPDGSRLVVEVAEGET